MMSLSTLLVLVGGIEFGLQILRAPTSTNWLPTLVHAVLGDRLPTQFQGLQLWWDGFRLTARVMGQYSILHHSSPR